MEDLGRRDPPLNARPFSSFSHIFSVRRPFLLRGVVITIAALVICASLARLAGQTPDTSYTLLSREGRRALPFTVIDNQEMVALDDLAAAFQLAVREESGAITVSYRGRTIVLTAKQAIASAAGRLISLPSPPVRAAGRWFVPVEFINRALAPVYDSAIELRRPSRLVILGDLRVPRVTIRHEPLSTGARLTIDAVPRTTSSISQDVGRLTIMFEADAVDVVIPTAPPPGSSIVQAVRSVDAVTIAVDLGPSFGGYRASTQTLDTSTRVVIDINPAQSDTPAPSAPSGAPAEAPPPADPSIFGRPVSAVRTIAIDPGHGGADNGARGLEGAIEKNLTLAVARRLKGALEARLGVRVLLTRDEDRHVPIDNRVAIANNNKADIFISLHANAAPRPSAAGAAIYIAAFSDTDRTRASIDEARVPTFGGGLRDLDLVLWDLAQTRHLDQSTEFARQLEERFQGRVPMDAQPVDRAPFRVLESANMPAVLIEMGYLSNPDDERRLSGNEFQGAFVQAVFDAVVNFRDYLAAAGAAR
jgi:N-acetylmuramoyl-L-alanine amidase